MISKRKERKETSSFLKTGTSMRDEFFFNIKRTKNVIDFFLNETLTTLVSRIDSLRQNVVKLKPKCHRIDRVLFLFRVTMFVVRFRYVNFASNRHA